MKNVEKGSIKSLALLTSTIALCGIIIFPLFDLIYDSFLTHTKFVYTINDHIVDPIIYGVVAGIILWIIERKKAKK